MTESKILGTPVSKQVEAIKEITFKNEIPSHRVESLVEAKIPLMLFEIPSKKGVIFITPEAETNINKGNICKLEEPTMETPEIHLRKIFSSEKKGTKQKQGLLFTTLKITPSRYIYMIPHSTYCVTTHLPF